MMRKIDPELAEDAFFLGLLHNIGTLALQNACPDQYSIVSEEMRSSLCSCHEAERHVFGFSHVEAGEYLIRNWGLPERFSIPIRYHHNPDHSERLDPEVETLSRILHLSSSFADILTSPEKNLQLSILEFHLKKYGFFDSECIPGMAEEAQKIKAEMFPLFEIEIGSEEDYAQMMEEARKQLVHVSEDLMERLIQQSQSMETLREQVLRDSLTGLYNYQAFQEALEREFHRSERYELDLSVIMLDIDHFKQINDNHGHLAGDSVLRAVADC